MTRAVDTLVIGGGVAGLITALNLARHHQVTLLVKSHFSDSSSYKAQGGIAAVLSDHDSIEKHIADTIKAGDGLCHEEVVRLVVEAGPQAMQELMAYGVPFSRTDQGEVHLTREAGHSQRRVWHVSDETGAAVVQVLMNAVMACAAIEVLDGYIAVDLITTDKVDPSFINNQCLGAYVLQPRTAQVMALSARRTVLCTGGHGRIYLYSSNPPSATGDGIAMAWRARVRIANLEFMQFHPTCLYHPLRKNFLISEALRGEGARLVNQQGQDFMPKSNSSLELRDVLSRQIYNELKRSGDQYVYLDVSAVKPAQWDRHFVHIAAVCAEVGINVRAGEPIPVVPCAHYSCGGVVVDHYGRTSLKGLYAAGEVSCTGLHGGNRLASNSLLEAIIFGTRLARQIIADPPPQLRSELPQWDDASRHFEVAAVATTEATSLTINEAADEKIVLNHTWDEIRRIMWNYVGIVRSTKRLKRALTKISVIQTELDEYYWQTPLSPEVCEVRNIAQVAYLTVLSALKRRESRGSHYITDYPTQRHRAIDTLL